MRRFLFFACVCAGILVASFEICRAQTTPSTPLATAAQEQQEIAQLIDQLGDPSPRKRDHAQRTLATFGNEAIPILQKAAEGNDPEVSSRARNIIAIISSSFRPTYVSLDLKNVTVREAMDALSQQSGLLFEAPDASSIMNKRVTLEVKREPLWAAVFALSDATDLKIDSYTAGRPGVRLSTRRGTFNSHFSQVSGEFAFTLLGIHQRGVAGFAPKQAVTPPVVLQMQICPEPRLNAQRVTSMTVTKCLDETGFPITPENNDGVGDPGYPSNLTSFPAWGGMALRPEDAKRIALIEGYVTVTVVPKTHPLNIQHVLQGGNAIHTASGIRFTMGKCEQTGELEWTVHLGLLKDGRFPEETQDLLNGLVHSNLDLRDSQSRPFKPFGVTTVTDGPGQVDLAFHFLVMGNPKPEKPDRLHWDVPEGTTELKVPFSFKDVPLP